MDSRGANPSTLSKAIDTYGMLHDRLLVNLKIVCDQVGVSETKGDDEPVLNESLVL